MASLMALRRDTETIHVSLQSRERLGHSLQALFVVWAQHNATHTGMHASTPRPSTPLPLRNPLVSRLLHVACLTLTHIKVVSKGIRTKPIP